MSPESAPFSPDVLAFLQQAARGALPPAGEGLPESSEPTKGPGKARASYKPILQQLRTQVVDLKDGLDPANPNKGEAERLSEELESIYKSAKSTLSDRQKDNLATVSAQLLGLSDLLFSLPQKRGPRKERAAPPPTYEDEPTHQAESTAGAESSREAVAPPTPEEETPAQLLAMNLTVRQAITLLRESLPLLEEAVGLSRDVRDLQRDALLNQLARAAQKPDFAIAREWADRVPDLKLFPLDQSWDEAWYIGAPPAEDIE